MKKSIIASVILLAPLFALATELANPDHIKPIKEFFPPKPITPNIAQGYIIENQFDRVDRTQYFSVVDKITQGIAPLKVSSGFYNRSFYHSLLSGVRQANYYAIFNVNQSKANNYKDARGNKSGWGYDRFNQTLILGFVPNEMQEHRLTFIHDDINDDLQPQHQMDPVNTERFITKLSSRFGHEDLSNTVNTELSYRHIERRANNYELRNVATPVYVDMTRNIVDLSLKYDIDWGKWHNFIGINYQHDKHNGERYRHTPARDILNGYRFADLSIERVRLFDNLSYKFNEQHKLGLGITYETNHAQVKKFNERLVNPQMPVLSFANPRQLWQYYFGQDFLGKVKQHTISAELKYDFTPTELQRYSLNAAHIERIGNNMERFNSLAAIVIRPNGTLMNQQPIAAVVSNPWLKPEEHNFLKFSFTLKNEFYKGYLNSIAGNGWQFGGEVMYDEVKNLIIFDRAHGQPGTQQRTNGIITRNVNAKLWLANLYAHYNFMQNWAIKIKGSYQYGQNSTDGRPLYQMRPFELQANLDYRNYFRYGSYNLGINTRYLAKQSRGDFDRSTGLGIDNRTAANSFFTTDLYAGLNFKDQYGLRLGVNNLFNRHYAEFISGNHVMALAPNVIYAPGRTYWISLHTSF